MDQNLKHSQSEIRAVSDAELNEVSGGFFFVAFLAAKAIAVTAAAVGTAIAAGAAKAAD